MQSRRKLLPQLSCFLFFFFSLSTAPRQVVSTMADSQQQHAVCVFCGSSPGLKPAYMEVATDLGKAIAQAEWSLVYGGGAKGCMGAVSASAAATGGHVVGIIPRVMASKPMPDGHPASKAAATAVSTEGQGPVVANPDPGTGRTETIIVQDMHERKKLMAKRSNLGFIGLPGGFGTFEEVMEMVTWTQLGIHRKPVVLINVAGFWSPIRTLIESAIDDGFIPSANAGLISFVEEADAERAGGWGRATLEEVQRANERLKNRPDNGYWDWSDGKQGGMADQERPAALSQTSTEQRAVDVRNLTYAFQKQQENSILPPALEECNLALTRGSRCLLIGANGAGKSTLLRLLAGKRLPSQGSHMLVFGKDVFHDAPRGITYLGTEWAMNPVVRSDILVSVFLDSVGGYRHKERRDKLLDILDVNLQWRMHAISDGERRRVQLTMGLMEPWDLLLLDEVTVDLDVQVRADLLSFLTEETKTRGATIIYATHIFDGLQNFPTHVVHMRHGTTTTQEPITWPPTQSDPQASSLPPQTFDLPGGSSSSNSSGGGKKEDTGEDASQLLSTALAWLRQDKVVRLEKEKTSGTGPTRGARTTQQEETDSE